MTINFNGLATGIDTTTLIEGIMAADRKPIDRLKSDKEYQSARLDAYGVLSGSLDKLLTDVKALNSSDNLLAKKASFTGESLVTATTTTKDAIEGSYQIRSYSFAQVEKDVSQGYADKTATSFGTGTLVITTGTTMPVSHNITIDSSNNSLEGIVKAINDAGIGVKAAIINDGTSTPYRLVVSGTKAGAPADVGFTIDVSGLTGGSYANPIFTETQQASQAHISVDGVDLYSNSNVFTDAIPGTTLTLDKADNGATVSTMTIIQDKDVVKGKIQNFVNSYNQIMTFVSSQSAKDGKTAGLLAGDSGMNTIKRHLQNILTNMVDTGGNFKSLAELGLETQRDGTLVLNNGTLDNALATDLNGVVSLLSGNGTKDGISGQFESYLKAMTDSREGFLASRENSINRIMERIDNRITQMQARLDQREKTLQQQFSAMEELVSGLNAQGDYLTQQMSMLANIWSSKK
ncbi:hypothetical protein C2E25_03785 [Geothermobacter hydrogeniphilus]|uniref:Flagellar hook-associated protein 2 n=1 Tax=Geothermobacter hydrogeniphilus TaxID=1969733 RepID=A0A2K2HCZ9_9BACT|nr:flagellar filament capping protein FliD [Geothermobacter hydrogeniphilus]PNU21166.1 hypothetical protein C2E25_03785 [Geothermobacter hydrogeniphilus]